MLELLILGRMRIYIMLFYRHCTLSILFDVTQISIVFQDEHLIVAHKPPGLLVHRSPIDKRETQFLMQMVRDQIGQYVYPVHRLDKPTSGLLILALNSHVARLMSQALEAHKVDKTYIALVRGYVNEPQIIDYPLVEQLDKMTDDLNKQNEAKSAITHIEPLARIELPFAVARYNTGRFSLMKLMPQTGRKHQLRRHMAHLRHPIVGDTTHGDGKQNRYASIHMHIDRLALCSTQLQFAHPVTGEMLNVKTTLDTSMQKVSELIASYSTFVSDELNTLALF
ncbi:tRNA pseudouridine(65) synthase TruC [Glaciecola sp. XM2]|uniref:tRNA pseudouridine(65) synthase TruC n=1 Tax=Glaciecola sp. XM2 TaxID=1914931 RepID=UPI00203219A3|nr:tRNA pseudouridine(65) synthase TruC [Glaciecola sp. XM2]